MHMNFSLKTRTPRIYTYTRPAFSFAHLRPVRHLSYIEASRHVVDPVHMMLLMPLLAGSYVEMLSKQPACVQLLWQYGGESGHSRWTSPAHFPCLLLLKR